MIEPRAAWAAFCPFGSPRAFIHDGSVRSTRQEVQFVIGEAWAQDLETPRQGWRRAYRAGWRAIKVVVSAETADQRPKENGDD